jgi:hypothetical protein
MRTPGPIGLFLVSGLSDVVIALTFNLSLARKGQIATDYASGRKKRLTYRTTVSSSS